MATDLYFDGDGRLHIGSMAVSKAAVDTYAGVELAGANQITGGVVDPKKHYRLLRSPAELAAASKSFTNLPITTRHIAGLGKIPLDAICGTTGSHARFSDPFLAVDGVLWSQKTIDALACGLRTAPSVGFSFDLDLTPGMFNGQHFDGRLKNIRGHHLAIVPSGRSGLHIVPSIASRSGLLAAA
jgi:hypothetical protein